MKTYLIFTLLTTISFVLLLLTNRLRQQATRQKDRRRDQLLELLSAFAFIVSLLSLLGNWTQVAVRSGFIKWNLFHD